MVGQTILKEGTLDIKPPASSFSSGWRVKPWKTCTVKLMDQNGSLELHIFKHNTNNLKDMYVLENITDVTMVTSKTHLHAFEIISDTTKVLVLSGRTEIESRDWIWTLRKILCLQALAEVERDERIKVELAPSVELPRIGLEAGIYDVDVTVSGLTIAFLSKSPSRDPRQTPVEPFTTTEHVRTLNIPLTSVGRFHQYMNRDGTPMVIIETLPDYMHGKTSLQLLQVEGADVENEIEALMGVIKGKVLRATNNLHDCIASTNWNSANID